MNKIQIMNSLAYWTIPPGFQNILKRLIAPKNIEPRSEMRGMAERNAIFKNKHAGERCFVLATGPSVKEQDLKILKGELCIGVSHFFLHKDIEIISPRYHVLAPYHAPFDFDDLKIVFEGFNKFYGDETTYFFGHRPYEYSIYDFLKKFPQYQKKNTFYLDYSFSQTLDETNFANEDFWDLTKKPFEIRSVIYCAMQIAFYMGCKEIYLIGCDHDYLNDIKRVTNHHFYREEDGTSDVKNLSAFTTEQWFKEYYTRWQNYRLIRDYAKQNGCQIFNATNGGMLDVFPRANLSDIFRDKY